jgi:hypothetical protein
MTDGEEKVFPNPIDFDELYPGRFMKAGELQGRKPTLKITSVKIDELEGDKGKKIKGVITFERADPNAPKDLALNKTNGVCLREMFGRQVQAWVGKRVTLFAVTIESGTFKGKEAIRIYGSPDIEKETEVTITLPRKRPVKMTMHKTLPKGAPAAQTGTAKRDTVAAPAIPEAIAKVRASSTIEALAEARKTIWGLYAAANEAVPLDVEAAANDRRLALEGE